MYIICWATMFQMTPIGKPLCEEVPETRTQMVMELWNDLLGQNLKLNTAHHNALLSVFNENRHCFSPAEFLASLEAKKVTPNRLDYITQNQI